MSTLKQSDFTPAQRAHTRRTVLLLVVYAIILPPLVWLRAHRHISDVLLIVMATAAAPSASPQASTPTRITSRRSRATSGTPCSTSAPSGRVGLRLARA
jgi:hypothetical protein